MTARPEHEKVSLIQERSQAIGEFLEWLENKGVRLCHIPDGYEHTFHPWHYSTTRLLAEYFEIDLGRLETEKRAILDEVRKVDR